MDYMKQAVSLAKLALGEVSPNPAVGAVIVKNDTVIGQGYTQPPGGAHAEVMALKQAGDNARGGVMYVTLEPCCHYGRTPPCTNAIIAAGIGEVHLSMLDPNPVVAGKGSEQLKKAGIVVRLGEHEDEARQLNEAYIKYITTGIPFVTAKFATSLDGKIATRTGDSKWISGAESRKYVHYLRYTADAVMAGANTVIVDNPRLTSRYGGTGGTIKRQPLRVIVDGRGNIPADAGIFSEPGKVLVVTGEEAPATKRRELEKAGAEIMQLPVTNGTTDLRQLLKKLGARQVTSVLVEGGGVLLGSLFDAHLVDKVIVFIAPMIIGGEGARAAIAGCGVEKIVDATRLERVSLNTFGEDLMFTGYVKNSVYRDS